MRLMERNKTPLCYLLYLGKEPVKDDSGNETGEYRIRYGEERWMRASVSAAQGSAQVEQFGDFTVYDKVIITDNMCCPINENTVIFLDKKPKYDRDGNPLYDYIVRRVARSLNLIAYAVSKVEVS